MNPTLPTFNDVVPLELEALKSTKLFFRVTVF